LFFIDIDDFKIINDNLGHYYGDLLLEEIAIRFKSFLDDEDIIIHLSGDEFLIVVYDICLDIDFREKANRIIDEMRKSFVLNGKEVHISCSVGIALYPEHGETIEEVMQKADISMYKAKNEGKNQVVIYNDKIEKFMNSKFEMISDLKTSVKNNDFVVHYQTKATTEEGEITGLEALVRWNHPTRGLVYPNDFIPLAEEIGVIKDIDIFVLNKACQQIEKWMKENKNPYNISVNISPIFFNQNSFILTLDKILSQYEINPSYISVEITENIALKDIHLTQLKINQLKKRNIKVHLDDFGRGYSSLSYIKDYPVDYLKIDKVFIDDIINNEVDQTLVKTIVNVSNLLGIKVIFEGVETKEQLDVLKKIGCNEYQGYFLSKPKPIDDIDLKF
jgi:diguanylate cyclase (GGDEF)-like protein